MALSGVKRCRNDASSTRVHRNDLGDTHGELLVQVLDRRQEQATNLMTSHDDAALASVPVVTSLTLGEA